MTTTIDALESAYQAGWMAAAGWANRLDLLAGMGSGAFAKEQDAAVQRIALALARAEQAEPYAYVYEFDHAMFGVHRSFSPSQWNGLKPSRTVPVYTAQPAAPAKLEPWMVHARKLVQWRHCMSYNDSYFGESPGLLKHITAELERLLPEEPLEAAHNAKLGGA